MNIEKADYLYRLVVFPDDLTASCISLAFRSNHSRTGKSLHV